MTTMKKSHKKTIFISFLSLVTMTQVTTIGVAGIFGGTVKAQFVQYRHVNNDTKIEVPLESIDLWVGDIGRTRPIENSLSRNPFTGRLRFVQKREQEARIEILEVSFIERLNGQDGRVFVPDRIYDDDSRYGRKGSIDFLTGKNQLPCALTLPAVQAGAGLYAYFDYHIPEEIREAELLVHLKVTSPHGEETFERRFPLKQISFVGDLRVD